MAKTRRDLGTAIGPGTSKTLVELLGKANTRALTYSTAATTAFQEAPEQGTGFFTGTLMHVEQATPVLSFDRRLTRR